MRLVYLGGVWGAVVEGAEASGKGYVSGVVEGGAAEDEYTILCDK